MELLDLTAQLRSIGRASVFYRAGAFAGSGTALASALVHLGDTEGAITVESNEEYSELTLPELTGNAPHEKYFSGEAPVITMPLYIADPDLRAIVSPTGSASGGYQRRRAVTEYTLVLIPEQVFSPFYDESGDEIALTYTTADGWQIDGEDASAAQLALLDLSFWAWRGHFSRSLPVFQHEDGGKAIQEVTFSLMHNSAMPDGHHLFTIGRPDQATPAISIVAP